LSFFPSVSQTCSDVTNQNGRCVGLAAEVAFILPSQISYINNFHKKLLLCTTNKTIITIIKMMMNKTISEVLSAAFGAVKEFAAKGESFLGGGGLGGVDSFFLGGVVGFGDFGDFDDIVSVEPVVPLEVDNAMGPLDALWEKVYEGDVDTIPLGNHACELFKMRSINATVPFVAFDPAEAFSEDGLKIVAAALGLLFLCIFVVKKFLRDDQEVVVIIDHDSFFADDDEDEDDEDDDQTMDEERNNGDNENGGNVGNDPVVQPVVGNAVDVRREAIARIEGKRARRVSGRRVSQKVVKSKTAKAMPGKTMTPAVAVRTKLEPREAQYREVPNPRPGNAIVADEHFPDGKCSGYVQMRCGHGATRLVPEANIRPSYNVRRKGVTFAKESTVRFIPDRNAERPYKFNEHLSGDIQKNRQWQAKHDRRTSKRRRNWRNRTFDIGTAIRNARPVLRRVALEQNDGRVNIAAAAMEQEVEAIRVPAVEEEPAVAAMEQEEEAIRVPAPVEEEPAAAAAMEQEEEAIRVPAPVEEEPAAAAMEQEEEAIRVPAPVEEEPAAAAAAAMEQEEEAIRVPAPVEEEPVVVEQDEELREPAREEEAPAVMEQDEEVPVPARAEEAPAVMEQDEEARAEEAPAVMEQDEEVPVPARAEEAPAVMEQDEEARAEEAPAVMEQDEEVPVPAREEEEEDEEFPMPAREEEDEEVPLLALAEVLVHAPIPAPVRVRKLRRSARIAAKIAAKTNEESKGSVLVKVGDLEVRRSDRQMKKNKKARLT
jgi:hypothetical protein